LNLSVFIKSKYVNNGEAEIDNNAAERMMKTICLGRNNYLFFGSEKEAKNASLMYSIIETCKMNGIRPAKPIRLMIGLLTLKHLRNVSDENIVE
jgi:hypothetical protein